MGMRLKGLAVSFLVLSFIATVATGCGPKKKPGPGEAGSDLTDQKLPGSSLEAYESGRRPPGDSGPLKDIHFAFDSYELDEQARSLLRDNAEWLKDNPKVRVEIEGHCDERGTVEYNLALGAKRAKAAKDYLATLGISSERMSTISYGEELPLCSEHTEACWAENRRCHFVQLS
jgi:peptidoglycan-associated lipoprotein